MDTGPAVHMGFSCCQKKRLKLYFIKYQSIACINHKLKMGYFLWGCHFGFSVFWTNSPIPGDRQTTHVYGIWSMQTAHSIHSKNYAHGSRPVMVWYLSILPISFTVTSLPLGQLWINLISAWMRNFIMMLMKKSFRKLMRISMMMTNIK